MLPNANEFATALNIEMRRSLIFSWIRTHYLALTHPELMIEGELVNNLFRIHYRIEEDGAGDFILNLSDALNATEFHSLEILGFISPELAELQLSEHSHELISRIAIIQGADQLVGRTAVFELGGYRYFLLADVVNYGGRWFISQVGGLFTTIARVSNDVFGLMLIPPEYLVEFYYELMENIVTEW